MEGSHRLSGSQHTHTQARQHMYMQMYKRVASAWPIQIRKKQGGPLGSSEPKGARQAGLQTSTLFCDWSWPVDLTYVHVVQ